VVLTHARDGRRGSYFARPGRALYATPFTARLVRGNWKRRVADRRAQRSTI
jgi:hypothetical protein